MPVGHNDSAHTLGNAHGPERDTAAISVSAPAFPRARGDVFFKRPGP